MTDTSAKNLLKQITKILPIRWGAILAGSPQGWDVVESFRVGRADLELIQTYLQIKSTTQWLKVNRGKRKFAQKKLSDKYHSLGRYFILNTSKGHSLCLILGSDQTLTPNQKKIVQVGFQAILGSDKPLVLGLADLAGSSLSLSKALQSIERQINRLYPIDRVYFAFVDSNQQLLSQMGIDGQEKLTTSLNGTLEGSVYKIGESIVINNFAKQSEYAAHNQNTASKLVTPIKFMGQVIGILSLESDTPEFFTSQHEREFEVVASQIGGIYQSLTLSADNEDLQKRIKSVNQILAFVGGQGDAKLIAAEVAEQVMVNFKYDVVMVMLYDAKAGEFVAEGLAKKEAIHLPDKLRVSQSWGLPGEALQTRESVLLEDTTDRSGFQSFGDLEIGSALCVPLMSGETVLGVISVEMQSRYGLSEFDQMVMQVLATGVTNVILLEEKIRAVKLAEQRLIQSEKLAAVGELAAGVAHELNNPLTTVAGFSELVFESLPEGSPERDDLQLVIDEAKRARSVVRRLLDFSRQDEFLRANADINDVLSSVLTLVHHQANINQIDIRVGFWDDLPKILVDRNQMQQVFLNLIYNAIQAMPEGGEVIVRTSVMNRDQEEWVVVTVEDSGVGIPKDQIDRIFEPFFTTKTSGKGTGLGLAVSYGIVSDHGGFIDVSSEASVGTEFNVWLPVKTLDDVEQG